MPERTHRDVFLLSIFTFLIGGLVGVLGSKLYKPTMEEVLVAERSISNVLVGASSTALPSSTTKAAEFRVQQQSDVRRYVHWMWVASRNADDGRDTVSATTIAREQFIHIGESYRQYFGTANKDEKLLQKVAQYADAVIAYSLGLSSGVDNGSVLLRAVEFAQDELVDELLRMYPGLSRDVLHNLLREYIVGIEKRDYERMVSSLGKCVDLLVVATVRAFPEQF